MTRFFFHYKVPIPSLTNAVVPSASLSGGFVPMTTLGLSSNSPPSLLSVDDHTMKVHVFSAEDEVERTL